VAEARVWGIFRGYEGLGLGIGIGAWERGLGVWGTWRASYAHCEDTDTEPVSVPYEICNIKLISQASDSDVGNSPTQRYRYRYGYYFLCWWWCERALSVRV